MMHGKNVDLLLQKQLVNDSTSEEQLVIFAHFVLHPKFCKKYILWNCYWITQTVVDAVLRKKGLIVFPDECLSEYSTIYHETILSSKCLMFIHLQFLYFVSKNKRCEIILWQRILRKLYFQDAIHKFMVKLLSINCSLI